jgi:hypothetical protein
VKSQDKDRFYSVKDGETDLNDQDPRHYLDLLLSPKECVAENHGDGNQELEEAEEQPGFNHAQDFLVKISKKL